MAREHTLLDRIATLGRERRERNERTAAENAEALIEAVRANLIRLLNSRRQMSEALPDYGLPALTDITVGTRDYIEIVRGAIREAVETYEPRLQHVRVTHAAEDERGPNVLAFRIDAVLVGRTVEYRVAYDTMLTGTGAVKVYG